MERCQARKVTVAVPADRLWSTLIGIGGERGWYSYTLLWKVRGLLDRLLGGVELRRGRRDREALDVGDALDFRRVEEVEPGRLLRLRAEMRLPGLAWLEWRLERGSCSALSTRRTVCLARLLVGGRALPRLHLRQHGAQHRGCRGRGDPSVAGAV